MLTHHSDFFENALTGDWPEARDKRIRLPEWEPKQFVMFLRWTLTGGFSAKTGPTANAQYCHGIEQEGCYGEPMNEDASDSRAIVAHEEVRDTKASTPNPGHDEDLDEPPPCTHYAIRDLLLSYCLGDILLSEYFKIDAIDEIHDWFLKHRGWPEPQTLTRIYERTPPGSPLRKLLIELYACSGQETPMHAEGSYPEAFLRDLVGYLIGTSERSRALSKTEVARSRHVYEMTTAEFCSSFHRHPDLKTCGRHA